MGRQGGECNQGFWLDPRMYNAGPWPCPAIASATGSEPQASPHFSKPDQHFTTASGGWKCAHGAVSEATKPERGLSSDYAADEPVARQGGDGTGARRRLLGSRTRTPGSPRTLSERLYLPLRAAGLETAASRRRCLTTADVAQRLAAVSIPLRAHSIGGMRPLSDQRTPPPASSCSPVSQ